MPMNYASLEDATQHGQERGRSFKPAEVRPTRRRFFCDASVTLTQHPWRLCSREGHGSRIAGSGFVHSYCITLLASPVALRLGNADFDQFMDFARWPWRPSIEPHEP